MAGLDQDHREGCLSVRSELFFLSNVYILKRTKTDAFTRHPFPPQTLLFISNFHFPVHFLQRPLIDGKPAMFIWISGNEIFILYAFPSRSYLGAA